MCILLDSLHFISHQFWSTYILRETNILRFIKAKKKKMKRKKKTDCALIPNIRRRLWFEQSSKDCKMLFLFVAAWAKVGKDEESAEYSVPTYGTNYMKE